MCTLADLDYDVFHATVDNRKGVAEQEYFVRPRFGEGAPPAAPAPGQAGRWSQAARCARQAAQAAGRWLQLDQPKWRALCSHAAWGAAERAA